MLWSSNENHHWNHSRPLWRWIYSHHWQQDQYSKLIWSKLYQWLLQRTYFRGEYYRTRNIASTKLWSTTYSCRCHCYQRNCHPRRCEYSEQHGFSTNIQPIRAYFIQPHRKPITKFTSRTTKQGWTLWKLTKPSRATRWFTSRVTSSVTNWGISWVSAIINWSHY